MFFNHVLHVFDHELYHVDTVCIHTYILEGSWRYVIVLAKEILLHIQPLGFLSQFRFTLNNTSWHPWLPTPCMQPRRVQSRLMSHGIRHISAGKRAMTPLQMRRSHHESDFECPAFITSSRMCLELFIGSRVARKNTKKVPPKTSC